MQYIGDEVNIAFEFDLAEDMVQTAKRGNDAVYGGQDGRGGAAFSTPSIRHFPYLIMIRIGWMSQLLGEVGQAKSAASLLLTGTGVPFLYYGEESGGRAGAQAG